MATSESQIDLQRSLCEPNIQTVDLSPFTSKDKEDPAFQSQRLTAAKNLVDGCHKLGFVKVIGHGLADADVEEAFRWTKQLFDLPVAEKMKAPHPPGNLPHRGYSGIGKEKVYHHDDLKYIVNEANISQHLRKVSDLKESYEIGSEDDDYQQNIWLPDEVLPQFRTYMTSLYKRLDNIADVILKAVSLGLGLNPEAHNELMHLHSSNHCQLRLLHYPSIEKNMSEKVYARLPAHVDWGTFTIVFQNGNGGLELMDPHSKKFLHAAPEKGSLVMNVGDMLQRFTNGYFISALHRVSIPSPDLIREAGVPARYSIPYFVCPGPFDTVATLPSFITEECPSKYEPVRFDEYGAIVSKYQYQNE